jgi:hypothetical protein
VTAPAGTEIRPLSLDLVRRALTKLSDDELRALPAEIAAECIDAITARSKPGNRSQAPLRTSA